MRKLLILLLLVLSVFSVSAGTTYLNSCGKSSGWLDNETYVLNFTQIPVTYTTSYCLYFNGGTRTNITIKGINQTIDNNNGYATPANWNFIYVSNGANVNQLTVKDLYIDYVGRFIYLNPTSLSSYFQDSVIDNVFIEESSYFVYAKEGLSSHNDVFFINNNITNSGFTNNYRFLYANTGGSDGYIYGIRVENSLVDYSNYLSFYIITGNIQFINSVIYGAAGGYTAPRVNFTGCTFAGYPHNDTNDDGIADSDLYSYHYSAKIYNDLKLKGQNYRFFQDYNEGEPFFNHQGDIAHMPIRNDDIGSPLTISLQSPLDSSIVTTNLVQASAFVLSDDIDCTIFNSDKCYFTNDPTTTTPSSNLFHNYLQMQTNSMIKGTNISITNQSSGSVDASIMGNYLDLTYSGISIIDNYIVSSGNILTAGAPTTSRPFVKLKANNVDIYDNIFEYTFDTTAGVGQFLYIDSLNPTTNKVYRNTFNNTVSTPLQNTAVFEYQADTLFYDNCLGSNVMIENSSLSGINATPYIGFNHTDGKVYYYNLGNYYEDNTGCVDGDSDGFCDSSYTSGTTTDTNPLASCGFDYASHLLTADSVVDNDAFNITLNYPSNNLSIEITSASQVIQFIFNHDSDFADLTCEYYIDGALVDTINNAEKTTNHTIDVTGWTDKTYTWYVNCANDFQDITSSEYNFTVSIVATAGEETVDSVFGDTGVTIFSTGSTEDTADGLIGLMSLIETPMGYFAIIGFVLMIFASIALIFALFRVGLNSIK